MKAILRSAVLGATVVTGVIAGISPASAHPGDVIAFSGTAKIKSFGTGTTSATASISGNGVVHGAVVSGSANASVTAIEDPNTCPITGTATGTVTASAALDVSGTVAWTRVGATAVITVDNAHADWTGTAVFVVTSPAGNPCGSPVEATIAGTVAR